jgi:D-tyrosyl-tRNA(Tyr) deacylase
VRAVIQTVRECSVTVEARETGKIASGLLVYLGVGRNDTERDAALLCEKIVTLRIFPDGDGKMNLSVRDVGGEIMVVSQFTLYGDARGGRRPSYSRAAEPAMAKALYAQSISLLEKAGFAVAQGEFQASMEVHYTNVGPVTILLDSEKAF